MTLKHAILALTAMSSILVLPVSASAKGGDEGKTCQASGKYCDDDAPGYKGEKYCAKSSSYAGQARNSAASGDMRRAEEFRLKSIRYAQKAAKHGGQCSPTGGDSGTGGGGGDGVPGDEGGES